MDIYGTLISTIEQMRDMTPSSALIMSAREAAENNEVQDKMIEMNQEQLSEDTIDRYGVTMPEYSEYTKIAKGKQTDYYTFHDTGAFYQSMYVLVDEKSFGIESDESYAEHIASMFEDYDEERTSLGLTDENFITLCQTILKDIIIQRLKENIWIELLF